MYKGEEIGIQLGNLLVSYNIYHGITTKWCYGYLKRYKLEARANCYQQKKREQIQIIIHNTEGDMNTLGYKAQD